MTTTTPNTPMTRDELITAMFAWCDAGCPSDVDPRVHNFVITVLEEGLAR